MFKMSSFQEKNYKTYKEINFCPIHRKERKWIETVLEEAQTLFFIPAITNMLNEVKEAMYKELKETKRMMSHHYKTSVKKYK